ncbi:hypothetical protein HPB47_010857 [Ixodes persulcatus]|uniref:Uncharacterized protein n=1 Tax=Ixodes persulcatus TaxID=34615 RepID=A0AC60NXX4_IXOPE|nr:hypothetical protein HPB47_010857 [Ixodes persulcatus]
MECMQMPRRRAKCPSSCHRAHQLTAAFPTPLDLASERFQSDSAPQSTPLLWRAAHLRIALLQRAPRRRYTAIPACGRERLNKTGASEIGSPSNVGRARTQVGTMKRRSCRPNPSSPSSALPPRRAHQQGQGRRGSPLYRRSLEIGRLAAVNNEGSRSGAALEPSGRRPARRSAGACSPAQRAHGGPSGAPEFSPNYPANDRHWELRRAASTGPAGTRNTS